MVVRFPLNLTYMMSRRPLLRKLVGPLDPNDPPIIWSVYSALRLSEKIEAQIATLLHHVKPRLHKFIL